MRATALLAVVRLALGSYWRLILLPLLDRDCGVTAAPLRVSFTPLVATVLAPSMMMAVTGEEALLPSEPGEGVTSAT